MFVIPRFLLRFSLIALMGACHANSTQPDSDSGAASPDGACGDPSTHRVELLARVEAGEAAHGLDRGDGIAGVVVGVEDRGWNQTNLGSGVTDETGEAVWTAMDVTDLPGCWGTVLDYVLVANDPSGLWASAEMDLNSALQTAIEGGGSADLRAIPLNLESME